MSLLKKLQAESEIELTDIKFYQNCEVEKVEWWLADCSYYPDLYWARLRTFSNGTADVLFQDENKAYRFENAEYAGYFIREDEFSRFQDLDEDDRNDLKIPIEMLIETPNWTNREVGNFEYIGKY